VDALGRIGPAARPAVPALEELRRRREYVREVAGWALGRIRGSETEEYRAVGYETGEALESP
jgi:hypothetical protein